MSSLTNFAINKTIDALYRGQALGAPATLYFGLIVATRGYSSNVRSAVVTSGDTVIPTTPNGHMYRCTTGGTCGSGEPSWPTTSGGTVTDGTAVWTEMTPDFLANTNLTEASGGSYARVGVSSSLANFAGTQSAGSTAASSGTSGLTSNNGTITFPPPTANWGTAAYLGVFDAASSGNLWNAQALTTPQTINNGASAPTIAAAAYTEAFT